MFSLLTLSLLFLCPYRQCHSKLDHKAFLAECVFDLCQYQGHASALCNSLSAFSTSCQEAGASVKSWRTEKFCRKTCTHKLHCPSIHPKLVFPHLIMCYTKCLDQVTSMFVIFVRNIIFHVCFSASSNLWCQQSLRGVYPSLPADLQWSRSPRGLRRECEMHRRLRV